MVNVLVFARARDLVGSGTIEMAEVETVGDLRKAIVERFPKMATLMPKCAVAVNDEYADDTASLRPNDRVAILPPVSGG